MHKTKKRFGQHFLQDQDILQAIVKKAELKDNEMVWEIGPGLGALTEYLLKHNIHLTIFEIDNDLMPALKKKYEGKCIIVHDDILRIDWKKYLEAITPNLNLCGGKGWKDMRRCGKIKIVTNLPYQISSPFLYKLTENHDSFTSIVVMLQKEVAKRLCAQPGKKDYGVLTLKIRFYFETEYLFNVSSDKFTPPPDVESAVIKLTPRADIPKIENINLFWKIVETAFKSRRKTLRNNLKALVGGNIDSPIDLSRRGETLNEEEFITLYDYMLQFISR